ncbi:hypothetical protein ACQEU8_04510 [Streptomyces sp. CA-250714]|uniref:hypothetical protein n=1 Tax=Streptomyces sp. CA-250714 TaxID=3240060 RepID=UPI003D8CA074
MTVGWGSRTLRAGMFAALCVLVAAFGHVLMSGSDVPAWALAAGAAVTGAGGWYLAGRERGLPTVVTVVVAAQALLHSAFSLAQSLAPAPPEPASRGASMHMGHHMGAMDHATGSASTGMGHMGAAPTGSMEHMGHMGHSASGTWSLGMLAAHLLAAVLCGLWLAYGEKAAFRILRAVAGWLAAPLRLLLAAPLTPNRPRVRAARRRSDRAPSLLLLHHAITSRGPPATAAVV